MDTSKPVLELIELESEGFASQVYDVVMGGNALSKSTMFVIIDELLQDLISQSRDLTDQIDMLWIVHRARQSLRDVMIEEAASE